MEARSHNCSRGFTLLELLLSMAITAVIVVMVFGAFRIGIRAWQRGERDSEKKHRLRIVTDLIQTQLRSIAPSEPMLKKEDALIRFDGGERQLIFVSRQPLDPSHNDMQVLARYVVESRDDGDWLYFWEQPFQSIVEPIDILDLETDGRHTMLAAMQSIKFRFLVPGDEEEGAHWEPFWEPDSDNPYPKAVNIQISDSKNVSPVQLFIPLPGLGAS